MVKMKEITGRSCQNGTKVHQSQPGLGFKGIWIPREYIEDQQLTNQERILLSSILTLCNNKENICYATNKYFTSILGLGGRRVQQLLAKLKQKGYLHIRSLFRLGVKENSCREMKILSPSPCKIVHPNNKVYNKPFKIEDELMKKVFESWINYRDELGKPLVESSRHASFKKLSRLSDSDPIMARNIVEQTIANGWVSLYPIKDQNKYSARLHTGVILESQSTDNFSNYDF